MGEKTRIQHYVPQLYLKYFSENSKGIMVFDKLKDKIESRNIEKVPAENYFYDIDIENIRNPVKKLDSEIVEYFKTQFIEKHFSVIEDNYKLFLEKIFSKIENAKKMEPVFTEKEIEEFSFYIIIQHLRTKGIREKIINVEKDFLNQFVNRIMKLDVEFDEYNKDEKALKHAKFMLDFEQIYNLVNIIKNHIWLIGKNETEQELYTSDTPLVRKATYKEWLNGLGAEGIRIGFPLNSKYILMMYDKMYFSKLLPYHNTIQGLKIEGVKDFNIMQIEQSERFIFCKNANFQLVREVIDSKNPN